MDQDLNENRTVGDVTSSASPLPRNFKDSGEAPEEPADSVTPPSHRLGGKLRRLAGAGILHIVLTAVSFLLILPFVWMLLTSVKTLEQVGVGGWLPQPHAAIKASSLNDPKALLAELRNADSPLAQVVDSGLTAESREELSQKLAEQPVDENQLVVLLNQSIAGEKRVDGETIWNDLSQSGAIDPGMLSRKTYRWIEYANGLVTEYDDTKSVETRAEALFARRIANRMILSDISRRAVSWPQTFQFGNYLEVFASIPFLRYYWNSLFIAGWVTFLQVFTSSLAAFAFARLEWPGRDKVFVLYLSSMMLPGLVMMLPNYQIMIALGLVDTLTGLVLPAAFTAFGTFLMRQFMLSIPASLDEAAEIDGAGKWRLFWDVILPLARPGLVTLGIFTFMGNYNSFFWPLVMLKSEHNYTLPIGLLYFDSSAGQETNLLMAAVAMSVIPMVIVFVVLQKQLVAGIQLGAVKG